MEITTVQAPKKMLIQTHFLRKIALPQQRRQAQEQQDLIQKRGEKIRNGIVFRILRAHFLISLNSAILHLWTKMVHQKVEKQFDAKMLQQWRKDMSS